MPQLTQKPEAFDALTLARSRAAFGLDHWAQDADSWTLIGLDIARLEIADQPAEIAWLCARLADRARPIGLFLHTSWFAAADRPLPGSVRRALAAMFEGRNLRFVASGDVRQFRQIRLAGIEASAGAAFALDAVQPWACIKLLGLSLSMLQEDSGRLDVIDAAAEPFDLAEYLAAIPKARKVFARSAA